MKYKREKDFLEVLCREYLEHLLENVGKDPIVFIHIAEDKLHDIDNPKACETAYWKAQHRLNKTK